VAGILTATLTLVLAWIAWLTVTELRYLFRPWFPPRLTRREYGRWYRVVYLNTGYWRRIARRCKKRAGQTCRDCGKQFAMAALEAHHPAWAYRFLWLEWLLPGVPVCLCWRCHGRRHGK